MSPVTASSLSNPPVWWARAYTRKPMPRATAAEMASSTRRDLGVFSTAGAYEVGAPLAAALGCGTARLAQGDDGGVQRRRPVEPQNSASP